MATLGKTYAEFQHRVQDAVYVLRQLLLVLDLYINVLLLVFDALVDGEHGVHLVDLRVDEPLQVIEVVL